MEQLTKIRSEIDCVDEQLTALFVARMQLAARTARLKKASSLPLSDSEREQQIISRVVEFAPPELASYTCRFFRELIEISKEYQTTLGVSEHNQRVD